MRHAHKNAASNEVPKPSLVPRLRFPEFEGAGVRSVRLGDVTEEVRSRNGNRLAIDSVMGVTKADGIVPMEARLIAADIARYKLVQKDCFAYNPMRLNIGSIARWKGECEILVSPDYVVFNCINDDESGIAPGFLDQFRQTRAWEEFVAEGGDGSVRVRIYFKDIARLGLALPSLPEQQRIASCLSSLDELITAQARKVDALKTHKKGLMQQLFPREGETLPRLRFPEFEGAWETLLFAELYEFKPTNSLSRDQLNYESGPAKNIHYGDIHTRYPTSFSIKEQTVPYVTSADALGSLKASAYCQEGDMVFADASEDLADVGKSIELVTLNGEKVLSGSHTLLARQKSDAFIIGFAGYLFKCQVIREKIERQAQGTKVLQISPGRLAGITVCFPRDKAEQQRIASCLSSLDELITNESNKLETYKTHKKGLMQGLFPKVGD